MYFNRTNATRTKTEDERIAQIQIFKAEWVDGAWANVTKLPFNSNSFSCEHPSLSKDGKTLYFASDMPGTIGGFDIYKVAVNEDGTYGTPENLGPKINTKHREQFPYISDMDVLYFASDGHLGYGGLDIFRSSSVDGSFDTPVNLGSSVNSNLDDFAFTIREKDNKGFVSSNRSGFDRLYNFARQENPLTKYLVSGIVNDKNSKVPLLGALVTLFDSKGSIVQDVIVGEKADYSFKTEPNKVYKIRAEQKGYISQEFEFYTSGKEKIQQNINFSLEAYKDVEARIKENEKGALQVELDKIYFDFNKSKIRPDAATTLNVLVDLMNKYPLMQIEVSAHTDARGNDRYNLNLSKRRAAATLEYLVSKGIDRNRLKSEGYGETQPLNHCIKPGMCDQAGYEVNRRCEFTILN
jgi:outer membrane protein OmpA-like peptidoglycan-associated protein